MVLLLLLLRRWWLERGRRHAVSTIRAALLGHTFFLSSLQGVHVDGALLEVGTARRIYHSRATKKFRAQTIQAKLRETTTAIETAVVQKATQFCSKGDNLPMILWDMILGLS